MSMLRDSGRSGYQLDEFIAPVHGFHGADANLLDAGIFKEGPEELFETLLRDEVASPSAQVNAAQHNFAKPCLHKRLGLEDCALQRHGAALSTNTGNDAEGTALIASILHFQIGPGTSTEIVAGKDRSSDQLGMGKDVANDGKSRG